MKRIAIAVLLLASTLGCFAQQPNTTNTRFTQGLESSLFWNPPTLNTPPNTGLKLGAYNHFPTANKPAYYDGVAFRYFLSEPNAALLYVPVTRTISINGTTQSFTGNPSFTIPTADFSNYYTKTQSDAKYKDINYVPTWTDILNKPAFSAVATSGSYLDLSNRPTTLSQFTNNLGNYGNWITKAQGDTYYRLQTTPITYAELTGKPTIPAQFNLIAGTNITLSGAYPNVTVNASGGSSAIPTWQQTMTAGNVSSRAAKINGFDGFTTDNGIGLAYIEGTGIINSYYNGNQIGNITMSENSFGLNRLTGTGGGIGFTDQSGSTAGAFIGSRLTVSQGVNSDDVAVIGQLPTIVAGTNVTVSKVGSQYTINASGGGSTVSNLQATTDTDNSTTNAIRIYRNTKPTVSQSGLSLYYDSTFNASYISNRGRTPFAGSSNNIMMRTNPSGQSYMDFINGEGSQSQFSIFEYPGGQQESIIAQFNGRVVLNTTAAIGDNEIPRLDQVPNLIAGANVTITKTGSRNYTIASSGSGSGGSVSSVSATTPVGLTVSGSPITSSGTLAFGLESGYSIPTLSSQDSWNAKQPAIDGTGYPYFTAGSTTPAWVTGGASMYLRANGTSADFKTNVFAQPVTITPVNEAITTGMQLKEAIDRTQGQIDNLISTKQNNLTLTTTGSGAATLSGATLNIPTPVAGAPATGGDGYIRNVEFNGPVQTPGGFNISGDGRMNTAYIANALTTGSIQNNGYFSSGSNGEFTGYLRVFTAPTNTNDVVRLGDLGSYLTTNTNQTGLTGNKTYTGGQYMWGAFGADYTNIGVGTINLVRFGLNKGVTISGDQIRMINASGAYNLQAGSATVGDYISTLPAASGILAQGIDVTSTLDFPSIAANSGSTLTVSVTGVVVGARLAIGLPTNNPTDVMYKCWVSSVGVISIRAFNLTGSAIDPPSGTYNFTVINNNTPL